MVNVLAIKTVRLEKLWKKKTKNNNNNDNDNIARQSQ